MFNFIRDFIRWRRLDRDDKCVATKSYTTTYIRNDGSETGETCIHIAEFWIDGNGERWTVVKTVNDFAAERHDTLSQAKSDWLHHSIIPPTATRVTKPAPLVVINGGVASA